ncbi:MAG TPA: hypothetical protein VKH14_00835 [Candidatus Udaeobacter sp.]|nr:hypothetical protein [Candidatus Udaeobacter sp.]
MTAESKRSCIGDNGNFPLVKLHIARSSDYIAAHYGFDDFCVRTLTMKIEG